MWLVNAITSMFVGLTPVDVHVHIYFAPDSAYDKLSTNEDLKDYLSTYKGRALLLSQAYLVDPRDEQLNQPSLRTELNSKTSAVVAQYRDRFIGLCGLNYKWADSHKNLSECLNMTGMKGVKIRQGTNDQFHHPHIKSNIVRAIETNKDKLKVVLIHLSFEGLWAKLSHENTEIIEAIVKEDLAGLHTFLDTVERYPNIQFIAAHSMLGEHALEATIARYKGQLPKNLWIEISTTFTDYEEDLKHKSALLLKSIGIDKLLFGSDLPLGDIKSDGFSVKEEFRSAKDAFFERPEFTRAEKQKIYTENGSRLFDLVK